MKRIFLTITAFAMLTGVAQAETINVSVNGLVCAFCATGIEKTFRSQEAVQDVKVDLESKLVTVHTKPEAKLDDATVTNLITNAGYTVTNIARQK